MADIHSIHGGQVSTEGTGGTKPLKSGGGDGTFDGMEHRIGRLETQMDRVLSELTDIKVLIASVDAKLDSKVDYKWLTVYILGIVAVILRDEILALFK
jgi:hypothetical protein